MPRCLSAKEGKSKTRGVSTFLGCEVDLLMVTVTNKATVKDASFFHTVFDDVIIFEYLSGI